MGACVIEPVLQGTAGAGAPVEGTRERLGSAIIDGKALVAILAHLRQQPTAPGRKAPLHIGQQTWNALGRREAERWDAPAEVINQDLPGDLPPSRVPSLRRLQRLP